MRAEERERERERSACSGLLVRREAMYRRQCPLEMVARKYNSERNICNVPCYSPPPPLTILPFQHRSCSLCTAVPGTVAHHACTFARVTLPCLHSARHQLNTNEYLFYFCVRFHFPLIFLLSSSLCCSYAPPTCLRLRRRSSRLSSLLPQATTLPAAMAQRLCTIQR